MADELAESPPNATLRAELRVILERRIDALPVAFRTVFVMREVEVAQAVERGAQQVNDPSSFSLENLIVRRPKGPRLSRLKTTGGITRQMSAVRMRASSRETRRPSSRMTASRRASWPKEASFSAWMR